MSLSVFAVICFTFAVMLMWQRPQWRRTQAVLMLVVGLGLAGAMGEVRDWLSAQAAEASAWSTEWLLGPGVAYAIALAIVLLFIFQMDLDGLVVAARRGGVGSWSRGRGQTSAVTPWLALLVPVSLAVLPLIGGLAAAAHDGATQLAAMVG